MPLITPAELIVLLDLPADTQPTDRAQLACDLVIDDINRVAGSTLVEPYAAGLKSDRVDNVSAVYPIVALMKAEEDRVRNCLGAGGPQYSFPEPDWSWKAVPALPD